MRMFFLQRLLSGLRASFYGLEESLLLNETQGHLRYYGFRLVLNFHGFELQRSYFQDLLQGLLQIFHYFVLVRICHLIHQQVLFSLQYGLISLLLLDFVLFPISVLNHLMLILRQYLQLLLHHLFLLSLFEMSV